MGLLFRLAAQTDVHAIGGALCACIDNVPAPIHDLAFEFLTVHDALYGAPRFDQAARRRGRLRLGTRPRITFATG